MLPTSYLAQDLLDKFSVAKKERITYTDDFYAVQVPKITILGETYENKWVSSALCLPAGSGQVNVTLVGDGSGQFDINGVPMLEFFDGQPRWVSELVGKSCSRSLSALENINPLCHACMDRAFKDLAGLHWNISNIISFIGVFPSKLGCIF